MSTQTIEVAPIAFLGETAATSVIEGIVDIAPDEDGELDEAARARLSAAAANVVVVADLVGAVDHHGPEQLLARRERARPVRRRASAGAICALGLMLSLLAACASAASPAQRTSVSGAARASRPSRIAPTPAAPVSRPATAIEVDLHYHPTGLRATRFQHLPTLVLPDGVVVGTNDPLGVGRVDQAGHVLWHRELAQRGSADPGLVSALAPGSNGELWAAVSDGAEARLYRLGRDGDVLGGPWRFTSTHFVYVTSPVAMADGDVVYSLSMVHPGVTLPDGRRRATPAGANLLVRMRPDGTVLWTRHVAGTFLLRVASADGVTLHAFGDTTRGCTVDGAPVVGGGAGTSETRQAFWMRLDGSGRLLAAAPVASRGEIVGTLGLAVRSEGVLLVWAASRELVAYQWLDRERGTPLGPMRTLPTDDAQALLMDGSPVAMVWDGLGANNLSIVELGRDAVVPLARLPGEPDRQLVPGALWQGDEGFWVAALSTPRRGAPRNRYETTISGPPRLVLVHLPRDAP